MADPIGLALGDSMCSWKRVNDPGNTGVLQELNGGVVDFFYRICYVNCSVIISS